MLDLSYLYATLTEKEKLEMKIKARFDKLKVCKNCTKGFIHTYGRINCSVTKKVVRHKDTCDKFNNVKCLLASAETSEELVKTKIMLKLTVEN
jgi:hypothetical protein